MTSRSRRQFLVSSTTALATGGAVATLGAARFAHAAGSDLLKIGLIGCGGRGTQAAIEALRADANSKLTAVGDMFDDRLQMALKTFSTKSDLAGRYDVPKERQFVGFDAYQRVIDSGVQVVLLATPPQFRPLHLKAAVAADKHVFAEKPVAVDAPGVRSVLATCAEARQRNLTIVSGLCLRYSQAFNELIRRVHDGAIGDIHTLQANDYRGGIWLRPREPGWTDMHWQLRNWYYFTWLSGDFNVEQHVHFLDVCAWLMKDQYPQSAVGMGGRQVRVGEEYGNIFDHHSVVYEYANGTRLYSNTRQMPRCWNLMNATAVGSQGAAQLIEKQGGIKITGARPWVFEGEDNNIYQTEHDRMFEAIRKNEPINNGDYMAKSTLLAIMGRMATYTGQRVTWEQALNSQEDLSPARYEFGPAPEVVIAEPGVTKLR